MVKFKSENLSFDVFLWIQLVSKGEKDTKMRLIVRADLNSFLKPMISRPMKEALDKIADVLSQLPYDSILYKTIILFEKWIEKFKEAKIHFASLNS